MRSVIQRATALGLVLGSAVAAAAPSPVSVKVTTQGDKWILTATYEVDAPEAQVRAVLTDFEAMPDYIPGLRESRVVARHGNVLDVEQQGTYHWGMVSGTYTSHREMTLQDHCIHVHSLDTDNGPMDSDTMLSADGRGTRVTYRAQWWPASMWVRNFGQDAVRSNLAVNMTAQYDEILRRAGAAPSRGRVGTAVMH